MPPSPSIRLFAALPRLLSRHLRRHLSGATTTTRNLRTLRLRADSVWCKVMGGNEASSRLASRIGLRHLKTHPDYPAAPGRSCQVDFYAMADSDYFDLAY